MLVSYPGNFMDAQQAARAFHERGALAAFVTGLVVDDRNIGRRLGAACLPANLNRRVERELRRRAITEISPDLIVSYPWLEILRTTLSRFSGNPIWADIAWDLLSHNFDRTVARRHLDGIQVVHGFEYTARYTFERAKDEGIAEVPRHAFDRQQGVRRH